MKKLLFLVFLSIISFSNSSEKKEESELTTQSFQKELNSLKDSTKELLAKYLITWITYNHAEIALKKEPDNTKLKKISQDAFAQNWNKRRLAAKKAPKLMQMISENPLNKEKDLEKQQSLLIDLYKLIYESITNIAIKSMLPQISDLTKSPF